MFYSQAQAKTTCLCQYASLQLRLRVGFVFDDQPDAYYRGWNTTAGQRSMATSSPDHRTGSHMSSDPCSFMNDRQILSEVCDNYGKCYYYLLYTYKHAFSGRVRIPCSNFGVISYWCVITPSKYSGSSLVLSTDKLRHSGPKNMGRVFTSNSQGL